ncbi:MAG: SIMPL domain-containing protein [Bacteroidota bacterium]|nr:SIMPL domain-containing protein [Bacteroidota bacterium]
MKNPSLIAVAILSGFCLSSFPLLSFGQSEKNKKKIEVMGSAEMEVVPDEIYLNISLREYLKDGKNKVNIETLEKELYNVAMKAGVPKENFEIQNIYGYNWQWAKRKTPEFMARKTYRMKLNDLNKVNSMLSFIDQKGIESVNIGEYTHSKIEEYKMELKAKALLAAREKANYLLKAIGEEAGGVLEIQEMYDGYAQPYYEVRTMDLKAEASGMEEPQIDFRKIKLKYEMKAVFEII